MPPIDRARLARLLRAEEEAYAARNARSFALYQESSKCLLAGVPMHWMVRSAGRFPVFVESARGAHFTSADGHTYIDFCLGDTGAMAGHAAPASVQAVSRRAADGVTFMLPTADAVWVGRELQRRFKLPFWQFALTATDANRFAIRLARHITGRPKVLVFNWCYHGTVDEAFITLRPDGSTAPRAGNIGPPVDPSVTTRVVEFNDVAALEAALAGRDVAAVLAEPAMTNIGIIHPDPGYHAALREITRRTGTLLIIDETHTICAGPGGYSGAHGLEPDIFVIGKPIAGGVPVAVYGFTEELAARVRGRISDDESDTGGIGGTLAGNALSVAAMRATLEHGLTDDAFRRDRLPAGGRRGANGRGRARMIALGERFEAGVATVIADHGLPWIVKRLGCRCEYWFAPEPPRNGGVAAAAADADLDRFMHLAALNRGILLTPFHNMALMCPATSEADVDRHTQVFRESVELLLGAREPAAAPGAPPPQSRL
ncbi:MAG: pyridoxal phosphate-dependent transferase [Monoraphidium minutum]|nr:MAG: pyridoxal phosphate-dependent transferase [Monoraphidium minutum]